jgi:hypothetical protein
VRVDGSTVVVETVKEERSESPPNTLSFIPKEENNEEKSGKLTKDEEMKGGKVDWLTYKQVFFIFTFLNVYVLLTSLSQYIISGGALAMILVLLLHITSQVSNILCYWWITIWTSHSYGEGINIGVYALLTG